MRQRGASIRVADLDVRATVTERGGPRVGFIVPKYRHNVIERNKLKRRLRELVRTRLLPQWREGDVPRRGVDIVLRAVPSTYGITVAELAARIDRVATGVRHRLACPASE